MFLFDFHRHIWSYSLTSLETYAFKTLVEDDTKLKQILRLSHFKDPSHLVSESGIKKMKLRRRKACLENHKVKTRKLIGLQVITL